MAGRDTAFPQRLRPHPRGVRGKAESTDRGDERGTQKSQGAACRHRPARKADQETAQAMGLHALPPGDHGVLHPRQANRPGAEYGEEALWDGGRDAGGNVGIEAKDPSYAGPRVGGHHAGHLYSLHRRYAAPGRRKH